MAARGGVAGGFRLTGSPVGASITGQLEQLGRTALWVECVSGPVVEKGRDGGEACNHSGG